MNSRIIVEPPISNTGKRAVNRLLERLGNSSFLNCLVAKNSFRGLASTFLMKWVSTGPEIRMAGMATAKP